MNIILREERLVYTLHYYKLEKIPDNIVLCILKSYRLREILLCGVQKHILKYNQFMRSQEGYI